MFELKDKEMNSFRSIISGVFSPTDLAQPQTGLPYYVYTHASDYQVGSELLQTHPDS